MQKTLKRVQVAHNGEEGSKGVTVRLEEEIYERVTEIAKKRDVNLRKFLNDSMRALYEREEVIQKLSPRLTLRYVEGRSMFIRDAKENRIFEVVLGKSDITPNNKNKVNNLGPGTLELACLEDNESTECVHVAFASASLELGRVYVSFKRLMDSISR